MKHLLWTAQLLLLSCGLAAQAAVPVFNAPTAAESPSDGGKSACQTSDYDVVWDSPSQDWNGSMPIGNGDIAANVWVEPDGTLMLLPSKSDALDSNARLLKLAQLKVRMDPPLVEKGAPFQQRLDLQAGIIAIRSGKNGAAANVSLWIDANNPVIRIEVQSDTPRKISIAHETWRTARREVKPEEWSTFGSMTREGYDWKGRRPWVEPDMVLPGQTDRIVFYHRNLHSVWPDSLEALSLKDWTEKAQDPLLHRTFGAMIKAEGMRNTSRHRLETGAATRNLAITIAVHTAKTPTTEQWLKELEEKFQKATPVEQARQAHRQWWADFWDRSWIRVRGQGDAKGTAKAAADDPMTVSRGYALQRWITACAGRGNLPIKFNGSLFTVKDRDQGMLAEGKGPMHDHDYRRHGPCWWWQNTRLPYWPMLDAGDFDMMKPLFKAYAEMLPLRRYITRLYYKHDGAFFDESIYPWGTLSPLTYGAADRKARPLDWLKTPDLRYYWQSGLELTAMMFRYYYYTEDREFLRETLLPFAHEIVTFYDQHYKRDENGKIFFSPANALEDIWNCRNPAPEIAGLKANLSDLIALTGDKGKRDMYQRLLSELPDFPTAKGPDGKTRILPALPGWDKRKYNSEKPELYCVFPYLLYGIGRPDLDVVRESWKYSQKTYGKSGKITPMGWSQDPIFTACLGLTGEARKDIVRRSKAKYRLSRFPAFWTPNFDWVPDQDHGGVNMAALQKMLMQSELPCNGRRIFLSPAWPEDWNCQFKLHAPHRTTVEGGVEGGKIVRLKVTPESRMKDVWVRQGETFVLYQE